MNTRIVSLAILALVAVGCASSTSVLVSGAQPGQKITKTQRSVFWGLIGNDGTYDPRSQCANGVSKVDVTQFITYLGFYSSYDINTWCAATTTTGTAGLGGGSVLILR